MSINSYRPIAPLFFLLIAMASCARVVPDSVEVSNTRTLYFDPQALSEPFGIAVSGTDVLVSDGQNGRIVRISRSGELTVVTDKLDTPSQIAVAPNGDIYVADSGSHTIRKIDSAGNVETVAGVAGRSGFEDGTASEALFRAPVGIALSGSKIYVADTYNDRIRVIENGLVRTVAGGPRGFADSRTANGSRFDTPTGIAIGSDGSVLVCDTGNARIRAVRGDGSTSTIVGSGGEFSDGDPATAGLLQPSSIAVGPSGEIWFTDGNAVRTVDLRPALRVRTVSNQRRGFEDGAAGNSGFNRPNGVAIAANGEILVADSENQAVRMITASEAGRRITPDEIAKARPDAEHFRSLAPARWPYDPPENKREIAGTLGEIRGENDGSGDDLWFHNGLDIVGAYGETARFIRSEKALRPAAAENFGTLRELLRLPTLGYIHIRLGRDSSDTPFDDPRFVFDRDASGKLTGVRVPRGSLFKPGKPIGTLNAMNHVHLIAGPSGGEMNALAALELPGVSDKIAPVIEKVELADENWLEFETERAGGRINIAGKTRIVVRAFDRMDGNAERRRLGLYRVGYQILKADKTPVGEIMWSIRFDRLPEHEAATLVFAKGSKSGATGETIFRYVVTNEVSGASAHEGFFEAGTLVPGNYFVRAYAADYFGNTAFMDLEFETRKTQ